MINWLILAVSLCVLLYAAGTPLIVKRRDKYIDEEAELQARIDGTRKLAAVANHLNDADKDWLAEQLKIAGFPKSDVEHDIEKHATTKYIKRKCQFDLNDYPCNEEREFEFRPLEMPQCRAYNFPPHKFIWDWNCPICKARSLSGSACRDCIQNISPKHLSGSDLFATMQSNNCESYTVYADDQIIRSFSVPSPIMSESNSGYSYTKAQPPADTSWITMGWVQE